MSKLTRREAIGLLATITLAACDRASRAAKAARDTVAATGVAYTPKFFTAHEWETVRLLADYVIPRDERSGSATDAGVPEFMDFMMIDRPRAREPMRGGLAWIDAECRDRFGRTFAACGDAERRALLDDIAWPKKAKPALSQGVAFFNDFRDLTASGFWSSRMGVTDLQYKGNVALPEWAGCPAPALEKLGVGYDRTA